MDYRNLISLGHLARLESARMFSIKEPGMTLRKYRESVVDEILKNFVPIIQKVLEEDSQTHSITFKNIKQKCNVIDATPIHIAVLARKITKIDKPVVKHEECKPNLGCATTRELLDEIEARIEIDGKLDYKTIDNN